MPERVAPIPETPAQKLEREFYARSGFENLHWSDYCAERIATAESALQDARTEGWISVEERLPEVGQDVLATFKGQFDWVMFIATMTAHYGLTASGYARPTHWQPLPAKPTPPAHPGSR